MAEVYLKIKGETKDIFTCREEELKAISERGIVSSKGVDYKIVSIKQTFGVFGPVFFCECETLKSPEEIEIEKLKRENEELRNYIKNGIIANSQAFLESL